jgi:hypothetical protein
MSLPQIPPTRAAREDTAGSDRISRSLLSSVKAIPG